MSSLPAPVCHDGSGVPHPGRLALRAGPLSLEYESGELRYVRLGGREVIRRWHVAVRDPNWGTVPGRIADEVVDAGPDRFEVRFAMAHVDGPIDFAWRGSIAGTPDGTIAFRMEGEARTTFARNRIGFCVLHPIRECAGVPCRYRQGDGTAGASTFPRPIAPSNPFHDLRGFAHEVAPGLWAELEFEGDLFDMEDQRNWIDASFKTFCTPLRLPFPVVLEAGTRVEQSVTLRLSGAVPVDRAIPAAAPSVVSVRGETIGRLPRVGLAIGEPPGTLSKREVDRLRALRPAHLRVELKLADAGYPEVLRRADEQARALGCGLEAALTVTDRADAELAGLAGRLRELRPPVVRWLIFHESEWSTTAGWIRIARAKLGAYDAAIPIVSGTTANFAELNRGRPPVELLDGVCFAIHPQEHASDNASLVETCAAIRDALGTAREFCGSLPLAVTPITLRKRVNPYATGPAPAARPGELPTRVDPRQMSLLGAGWTLASLKSLAEGGAGSTTWYETVGWLGVMESEAGGPLPDRFPTRPGMVYPLYHVLADACERQDAEVVDASSSDPLRFDALALLGPRGTRVLVANLSAGATTLSVAGLGASARVRLLDEATFEAATQAPEAFRGDPGTTHPTRDGRLELPLRPYAYARIDTA